MITPQVRKQINERDKDRCQECGLKVGKETGLEKHIHHIVPKSDGGPDTLDNLITLCLICHATKIRKHWQLVEKAGDEIYPQHVKWALWEIGLNLAYSGVRIHAKKFPKYEIAATLESAIDALEGLKLFVQDVTTDGNFLDTPEIEEVCESIKIAHKGWDTQKTLDWQILRFSEAK